MALPKPNLDDRTFQNLVDEAKRLIPRYCPEWTDHNVSDPGVTLIELFAYMVESLIYRVNRVPEKSYITFMELMGVRLQEPAAARTELTFWLTASPSEPLAIAQGTEVATVQTAADAAVSFTTDYDLVISPPLLFACLTSPDERNFNDRTRSLEYANEPFPTFEPQPQPGNAFYLGFESDLSNHIMTIDVDIREIAGISIDPKDPPLAWEAFCKLSGGSSGWVEAEVTGDTTKGLNGGGRITLFLPPRMTRQTLDNKSGFWVRCRAIPPRSGRSGDGYSSSPKIFDLQAASLGATVSATHAQTIRNEVLGRSSGMPGQHFRLEIAPVLPRRSGETIEVQNPDGSWEAWEEREHFGTSMPGNMHFALDSVGGVVSFGPTVRDPEGGERQYGAIPPEGSLIRMARYRSGGGVAGNVGAERITVLKTAVPYIARVHNRKPSVGGRDAETLEHAKMRAPKVLRTSFRAVSAEDYEFLAREASPGIARVRCLQPRTSGASGSPPAGVVRVLIVPHVGQPERRLLAEQLRPPREMVQDVQSYLDERRLLTTRLEIGVPTYTMVGIQARLKARPEADLEKVRVDAEARLYRFINPLVGGPTGEGWPFGRDLYISEVLALLQGTSGVEYVEGARMQVPGQSGEGALNKIALAPDNLIASAEHAIVVVK